MNPQNSTPIFHSHRKREQGADQQEYFAEDQNDGDCLELLKVIYVEIFSNLKLTETLTQYQIYELNPESHGQTLNYNKQGNLLNDIVMAIQQLKQFKLSNTKGLSEALFWENKYREAEKTLQLATVQIQSLQSQLSGSESERSSLFNTNQKKFEKIKELSLESKGFKKEIDSLADQNQSLRDQIQSIKIENESKQRELKIMAAKVEILTRQLELQSESRKQSESIVCNLQQEIVKLQQDCDGKMMSIKESSERNILTASRKYLIVIEELGSDLAKANTAISDLEQHIDSLELQNQKNSQEKGFCRSFFN